MKSNPKKALFEHIIITDKGKKRQKNEDFAGFYPIENGFLFLVCDGLGGHVGGEIASEIAARSIKEFFQQNNVSEPIPERIFQAIIHANNEISTYTDGHPEYAGMATTVSLCLIIENKLWYGHVGDCRIYHLSEGALVQLSKDDTFVQRLIDQDIISPEAARNHPRRNELTKSLGISSNEKLKPQISEEPLEIKNNEIILICSDGLNTMINDQTIEFYLKKMKSLERTGENLLKIALDEGGFDNITFALIRFVLDAETAADSAQNIYSQPQAEEIQGEGTKYHPKKSFNKPVIKLLGKFSISMKTILWAALAVFFVFIMYDLFFKKIKLPVDREIESYVDTVANQTNENTGANEENIIIADDAGNESQPDPKDEEYQEPAKNVVTNAKSIQYEVQKGETMSGIAQRFNLSQKMIMRVNNLKDNQVNYGQKIIIPLRDLYKVKFGDNLYTIAKNHNTTREILRRANKLKSDADIKAGQTLYIPFD